MAKRIEHLQQGLVNIEGLSVFGTTILKLQDTQTNLAIIWIIFDHPIINVVDKAAEYHKRLFLTMCDS